MSTLTVLRTSYLNVELGLDDDSDNRFGTTAVRESALQNAFRRIWPRMARYGRETITLTETEGVVSYGSGYIAYDGAWSGGAAGSVGTYVYELTELKEVLYLELLDPSGVPVAKLDNFRVDTEDSTVRLLLAVAPSTGLTCYAYGYAPYTVPSTGSASSDLPADLEWIIVQGARAELYRRLLNQFAVYERHENENRRTSLAADQMIGMAREAERMFQEGIALNRRKVAVPRRAIPLR